MKNIAAKKPDIIKFNQEFIKISSRLFLCREWEKSAQEHQLTLLTNKTESPLRFFVFLAYSAESIKNHGSLSPFFVFIQYIHCRTKAFVKTIPWMYTLFYKPYQILRKSYRKIRGLYYRITLKKFRPKKDEPSIVPGNLEIPTYVLQQANKINNLETQINFLTREVTNLCQRTEKAKYFFHIQESILGVPQEEWQIAAKIQQCQLSKLGITKWIQQFVRPDMTILDIGASIGQYTILMAKLLQDKGKLHVFEPTPRIHATLLQNMDVNGLRGLERIETHHFCVKNELGVTHFYDYLGESERNNIYTGGKEGKCLLVPSISLDEFFAPGTSINLIKIAIEGAEFLAFQGMRRVLADNPNIHILVEFTPSLIKRAGSTLQAWVDFFSGWQISRIDPITGLLTDFRNMDIETVSSENLLVYREGYTN